MTTYRHIQKPTKAIIEFLVAAGATIDLDELPAAIFVGERDGSILIVMLLWQRESVAVSIVRVPDISIHTIVHLARVMEEWIESKGATHYTFCVHKSDLWYRRSVEHRGAIQTGVNEDGEVWYVQPLHPVQHVEPDAIRPWSPGDWSHLSRLMRGFLTEHHASGGDFPPTKKNVDAFVKRGLRAVDEGDPTLLVVRDQKIVGFCLWVARQELPDLDSPSKTILGLGTYIEPSRRRQGLSVALRECAQAIARKRGFTRLEGIALDSAGLKASQASGAKAVGVVVRHTL